MAGQVRPPRAAGDGPPHRNRLHGRRRPQGRTSLAERLEKQGRDGPQDQAARGAHRHLRARLQEGRQPAAGLRAQVRQHKGNQHLRGHEESGRQEGRRRRSEALAPEHGSTPR